MNGNKLTFNSDTYPSELRNIPDPPRQLYVAGEGFERLMRRPRVTVVGSRKASSYGRAVTTELVNGLVRAGVVIVSGLAIGVDSIAHSAAVASGGQTIAVLPRGLDAIYPSCHSQLARQIVEHGGALVTEYAPGTEAYPVNFIARNRITAGLGQAVLIVEAALKSGTLHTVRFALEQGKDVLAVPGNITSPSSAGTNNLLRTGATPVTSVDDVLYAIGMPLASLTPILPVGDTPDQQKLIDLLASGTDDGHELLTGSGLTVTAFNQAMTMLEIAGHVRPLGMNRWTIR